MSTVREHMQADIAYLFAQDGEEVRDILIAAAPHRAIVQELDVIPGAFEGAAIRRQALWLEKGKIPIPRPGYTMDVDGELWTVESADPNGLIDIVTLALYR